MASTSSVDERPASVLPPDEIHVICTVGAEACVLLSVCASADAERLARRIHVGRDSPRGRFLTVDCGLPDRTLDEELFGRLERPVETRCTLFLHEVGRLPFDQQMRLMVALRNRGLASRPAPSPARVVSSTSEDLFRRVVEGSFDASLFYSLNTIHVDLRPH